MKASTLPALSLSNGVLAGSLAANAALAVFLLVSPAGDSPTSSSPALPSPAPASSATQPETSTASWTALKSDELSTQRDRLRAEGFPPSAIRAVLAAQIREGYAARRKAIEAAQGELPFWKNPAADPKTQAEFRALAKLEQQALKDLLGSDPEQGTAANLRRQLPGLFPDKIDDLAAIRERYDEQRQAFYLGARALTPDDREKMAALDKAMHAEIATVLTPQELEDYDIRTSNSASQLRYNLTAFDATEAEFRALYKLQSAFDDQFRFNGTSAIHAWQRARMDAQKQMNEQIAASFGADRYTEYQRATDYNYRQTTQLVARLELPPEAANQVYAVQQDLQQRARTLQSDRNLAPADRTAQLTVLATEAQTRVTSVLGSRGYDAYKQNGGSWMTQLQPRPIAPPRPAIGP